MNGITEFAVTHLAANRIEIRCDHRNVRSQRVAERCGFQREGTLRNQGVDTSGELTDICLYAKTAL